MFSFHKIINSFNNILKNINKSELIINNYIKLNFFKKSYYVNLLYIIFKNNYIKLNDLFNYKNLPLLFSLNNSKAQLVIVNLLNKELTINKFTFIDKVIILLKIYINIVSKEILSLNFFTNNLISYMNRCKIIYKLIILEYKYAYLMFIKKKFNKNNLFFNNLYIIKLNYFLINYNYKPLFKFIVNLNLYLSVLRLYNFIKTIFIPISVSLLMLFLLVNFFKIEIYTNIGI